MFNVNGSPINHSAYDKLNKMIHKAVKDVVQKLMNEASEVVVLGGGADIDFCSGLKGPRPFWLLNLPPPPPPPAKGGS